MSLFLKNATNAADTWCGQLIQPGAYYLLSANEVFSVSKDAKSITDIGSGALVVAASDSGTADYTAAAGMKEVFLIRASQIADPFPVNEGNYKFCGNGGSAVISGAGTTNGDFLIPGTRYVNGAEVWLDTADYGAYLSFQIVDKDGFGVTAGWYTQNQFNAMGNLYVVNEFGTAWQLTPNQKTTAFPGYLAKLYQGLYVRMKVTVPAACTFYYNLYLHKVG